MGNNLLSALRKNDKKGLFSASQVSIGYPTGFATFDYLNGYIVEARDKDENVIGSYPTLGLTGGSFITVVGKTGTAKTTWCIQTAYNIVKNFKDNAFVFHYDLEQAITYTRVANITGASRENLLNKYVIKQGVSYIEDIFNMIYTIANEKEANKNDYLYDPGICDEFGNEMKVFVPTVVIIDSIPTLSSKNTSDEMEGATHANRVAKEIAQFYKRLMPIIKTYNITVMAINHVNAKIEINPFAKTQAQVMYLKQDESVPGGNAPLYYAHTLIKFVSKDKYKSETDGFDGFLVRAELLKCRTNNAGKTCDMVYNQRNGFDSIMTLYKFIEDSNLVEGRNPYRYFKGYPDNKFDSRKFVKEFKTNPELRKILIDIAKPALTSMLALPNTDVDNIDLNEEFKK